MRRRRGKVNMTNLNRQTYTLPDKLASSVKASLEDWSASDKVSRLWAADASLWTGADEGSWLGWLSIVDDQLASSQSLTRFAHEIKNAGFSHLLLLGMGGSSLCPEVMKMTFGKIDGFPELHGLDSTDPSQVKTLESQVDLARTVFIVSSKSGSTLEPNIFKQYFWERAKAALGEADAAQHFIAITDPGSALEKSAQKEKFRTVFHGVPTIGGRYSVL